MISDNEFEDLAAQVDPTQLSFKIDSSILNQEIAIRFHLSDPKSFNALLKILEDARDTWNEEIKFVKDFKKSFGKKA